MSLDALNRQFSGVLLVNWHAPLEPNAQPAKG